MNNEFDNGGWAMNDYESRNEQVHKEILIGGPTEFKTLFWAELVIMISFALIMFSALVQSYGFAAITLVVMVAASVVYLVYVMKLKHYSYTFKEAGIYYLVYFILYLIHNNLGGLLLLLVNIAYFIFLILYVIKFCDGCVELLKNTDKELATSWDSYKSVMLFAYALAVICEVLAYVPVINVIATIAFIVISLAQIGFYIWHIILLNKTDAALRMYRRHQG